VATAATANGGVRLVVLAGLPAALAVWRAVHNDYFGAIVCVAVVCLVLLSAARWSSRRDRHRRHLIQGIAALLLVAFVWRMLGDLGNVRHGGLPHFLYNGPENRLSRALPPAHHGKLVHAVDVQSRPKFMRGMVAFTSYRPPDEPTNRAQRVVLSLAMSTAPGHRRRSPRPEVRSRQDPSPPSTRRRSDACTDAKEGAAVACGGCATAAIASGPNVYHFRVRSLRLLHRQGGSGLPTPNPTGRMSKRTCCERK
jgi:hypothetical protein